MKRAPVFSVWILFALLFAFGCAHKSPMETALNEPRSLTLASGQTLEFLELGDSAGQPILFLHGYTDSLFSYSRIAPLMAPSYRAIYLSMRGHGKAARANEYAMETFARDAVEAMDALNIENAVVVGHSMGSIIAQKMALLYPKRVEALVLLGSAPSCSDNAVLSELMDYVNTLKDPIDPAFVLEFQASTVTAPVPKAFMDRVVKESLKLDAATWKEVLRQLMAVDHRKKLKEIDVPTLVMWGENDGVFGTSDQLYLGTHIPKAVLKLYPKTGHGLHWERPETVAADMQLFIESATR